jgi:hypothetical protein
MAAGRPTSYTAEIATEICDLISEGYSTRKACEKLNLRFAIVWNWLKSQSEFQEQYVLAKACQADLLFDEIIDIADDASKDVMGKDAEGKLLVNHAAVQRAKLQCDARKWVVSKMLPKKYGRELLDEASAARVEPIGVPGVREQEL